MRRLVYFRVFLLAVSTLLALCPWTSACAESVPIEVRFRLYDAKYTSTKAEYTPVPNIPVRIVLGATGDWQSPDVGNRVRTNEKGEVTFNGTAFIDRHWKKYATSETDFIPSLFIAKDRLLLGVEIDEKHPTLFCEELDPLSDGSTESHSQSYYVRGADGRFSREVWLYEGTFKPSPDRALRPGPSFSPMRSMLTHEHDVWKLDIWFLTSPVPIPITDMTKARRDYIEIDGPYNLNGPSDLYKQGLVHAGEKEPQSSK